MRLRTFSPKAGHAEDKFRLPPYLKYLAENGDQDNTGSEAKCQDVNPPKFPPPDMFIF